MATKKKLLQAAAGSAGGGAGLNVEELFSTYLWDGTGSFGERTIANGIDLSGEGGLVWVKDRENAQSHGWYDTERGATKYLQSNATSAEATVSLGVTSFKTNGFGVDYSHNNADYASWTFRKAPKFFDVVTYTGTGVARTVSHNLGAVPAAIFVKQTSGIKDWNVYHRGVNGGVSPENYYLQLNTTNAAGLNANKWNNTAPTDTVFTVGSAGSTNTSGETYVAYLFAHNDGDGDFGPTGDQDIIKCGYWDSVVNQRVEVDLGFEPQFVIIKGSSYASDWRLFDNMRGITDGDDAELQPHTSNAETNNTNRLNLTSTGFSSTLADGSSGNRHIYIAIRRGPMAVPTDATDVFDVSLGDAVAEPYYNANFPVDMAFNRYRISTAGNNIYSRLTGSETLDTSSTAAASSDSSGAWDYMDGWYSGGRSSDFISWMWRRAPSFFDVVAYQGTGVAGFTFNHNLGVKPEMIWVKNRGAGEYWAVYHKDLNGGTNPSHYFLKLNDTNAETDYNEIWNDTEPTDTQVTVGQQGVVNSGSFGHIAYLFASLDGVSKCGSFSHTSGSNTDVDCGFSNGARFVLIKRTDNIGHWITLDTERGIVTGNDAWLSLNLTSAENTSYDLIDPLSSGFTVDGSGLIGTGDYIFYAIA